MYEVISVNYLHQIIGTDLLNTIKVYITSKYNADGVLLTYWLDGDNLEFTMHRSTYSEIGLEERETIYMKEKTLCSSIEGICCLAFVFSIAILDILQSKEVIPFFRIILRLLDS